MGRPTALINVPFEYTTKFQEVLNKLQELSGSVSEEEAKQFFRDEMLKLGHVERVKNLYRIRDKFTGTNAKFKLNPDQRNFLETQSGRDLILKPRQVGFTTVACVESFDKAMWEGKATGIMAHRQEKVKLIFEIIKTCNECFKEDWGYLYSPTEEANNTTRLSWSDPKGSVTVAFDFQGLTVSRLHVSEAAFIDGARLTNSLQAVPDNGEIILESTPNGRGGFFYDAWLDWNKNPSDAPFKGHFYSWFNHYPEDPSKYAVGEDVILDSEEEGIKEKFKLQNYHIIWRRYKIRESCRGSSEVFEVQYPTDDITCFLANDNSVFNTKIIGYQESFVKEPRFRGRTVINGKRVEFLDDAKGIVKIFKLPEVGNQYAVGADPSSGKGGDPGSICVLDYKSGEQVATVHGFLEPDIFADELYKICQFYNQAHVCVESNNHGEAVILKLKPIYNNFYKRQDFDTTKKKVSYRIGFYTTIQSKLTITDFAVSSLRDGKCIVREKETVDELTTFVNVQRKTSDGRLVATMSREAAPGCHDDRVMSLCLALEMLRSKPVNYQNSYLETPRRQIRDSATDFVMNSYEYDFSL